MPRAILPVLAAALVASGCGGGQSDSKKVENAVTAYYTAFGRGDTAGACTHLSIQAIKLLERSGGGKKCSEVLAQALKRPAYARIAPKLKGVEVLGVKVSGSTARATAKVPGAGADGASVSTAVPLLKESGDWKIVSTASGG